MVEMDIVIDMEEGDPLGATPNDKLVIVKIQAGTISVGHLKVGDQVKRVNNMVVKDQTDFYRALRYAHPQAIIRVIRDSNKAAEVSSSVNIPREREQLIKRRDGFLYEFVRIDYTKGNKLGLSIKHFQNRVLVHGVEAGSLAEKKFFKGDHIIDIDAVPVTDKEVAKKLMIEHIRKQGWFSSVVERPDTMETKLWVQKALEVQSNQPPSVQLNADVLAIMARMRVAHRATQDMQQIKPILTQGGGARRNSVSITEQPDMHDIGHDNVGRQLRKVKN